MKRLALAIASLRAAGAPAQVPAGWKTIKDDAGPCQMAVPAEWKQQDIMGQKIAAAKDLRQGEGRAEDRGLGRSPLARDCHHAGQGEDGVVRGGPGSQDNVQRPGEHQEGRQEG